MVSTDIAENQKYTYVFEKESTNINLVLRFGYHRADRRVNDSIESHMGLVSTSRLGRTAASFSHQRTWTGKLSHYVVCGAQGSGKTRTRTSMDKLEPRRKSQSPSSQTGVERTLSAVETVALGGAVLSHAVSTRSNESSNGSSNANASAFLTSFVLAALVIRKIASTVSERKREGSPTSQAMLRLRNVETSLEDHGKILDSVIRQVDALKTRTRFVGRDVRTTMKQMENTSALTGDVLQDTAARMELLEERMSDVEVLIGSVHEVVSKQLTLISDVVTEQKSLSKTIAQRQSAMVNNSRKDSRPIVETKANDNYTTHSSSSIDHSTEGAGEDEWGRQTISGVVPRNQTARRDSRDGSILFSFDSN